MSDDKVFVSDLEQAIGKPRKGSKLTPEQRYEVARRRREGESAKDLATEYGITTAYVSTLASR